MTNITDLRKWVTMEIGIQFLANMVVGWYIGQWISGGRWWAGLLGGLIGFIGAMYQIYKKSLADIARAKQERDSLTQGKNDKETTGD